jgi:hypothetical protein
MHARVDQLLSLRDGEPLDAEVRAHVESCRECCSALVRLQQVRERLRALPPATTEQDAWPSVEYRLATRALDVRRSARLGRIAAAASVAALAVFALLALNGRPAESPVPARVTTTSAETDGSSVDQLQQRSLALEELLAAMPSRPAVERADVSMPIDTLEAQVQWLDHQLSLTDADAGRAGSADVVRLWRERVEIMSSLVKLRSVEAQRVLL